MTNLLTRRLALFRIASVSAVAATAATPAALTAVQPKTPENPTLLRLGRKLEKLDAICRKRLETMRAARAHYEAICPELPKALISSQATRMLAQTERESDCDGEDVWPADPGQPPRSYHSASCLQIALEDYSDAGTDPDVIEERELLRSMLAVAVQYEQGVEDARRSSGYGEAKSLHYRATTAIENILRQIADIPAMTPDGITIKARVYEASAVNGTEEKYRAALLIGPGLAADICRVLSEGGEA